MNISIFGHANPRAIRQSAYGKRTAGPGPHLMITDAEVSEIWTLSNHMAEQQALDQGEVWAKIFVSRERRPVVPVPDYRGGMRCMGCGAFYITHCRECATQIQDDLDNADLPHGSSGRDKIFLVNQLNSKNGE